MKKKRLISILLGSYAAAKGYSALIEKRSLSSFLIEKGFQTNRLLQKNALLEDQVYSNLNQAIKDSQKPLPLPQKYISSTVYDVQCEGMQVMCWNDQGSKDQHVILYIHGGAYVSAPMSFHYKMVERIAKKTNAKVIFPIYEKIPLATYKDVFPKMLTLYKQILDDIVSAEQLTIMGDSAGGGLSLGLSLLLKEQALPQPKDIILLSPWLDVANQNPAIATIQKFDSMLDQDQLNYYGKLWSDGDVTDPLVSPKYGDPEGLGKISIFIGTHEIFYPDNADYHERLVALNIEHNFIVAPRMNHVYVAYPIPEAKQAQDQIVEIILAK